MRAQNGESGDDGVELPQVKKLKLDEAAPYREGRHFHPGLSVRRGIWRARGYLGQRFAYAGLSSGGALTDNGGNLPPAPSSLASRGRDDSPPPPARLASRAPLSRPRLGFEFIDRHGPSAAAASAGTSYSTRSPACPRGETSAPTGPSWRTPSRRWATGASGRGLRAYYRGYAARHGKPRWGDKTPGKRRAHMDALASALPEARFIHLIRDGRDVAASLRGLPFAPGDGAASPRLPPRGATRSQARRIGAGLPHYREVRYERLRRRTGGHAAGALRVRRAAVRRCGLPRAPRARPRATRGAALGARRVGWHGAAHGRNAHRGPHAAAARPDTRRSWREALSRHDVARFERFAGGALAALGYEPSYAVPSGNERRGADAPVRDRSALMRIVIGAQALAAPGGTETYVATVARELERRHEVTVTAEELGPMADHAGPGRSGGKGGRRPAARLRRRAHSGRDDDSRTRRALSRSGLVYVAHSDRSDYQVRS